VIRRALSDFWTAFRWSELDCGCAFTVLGPRRVRTCTVHSHATAWIAGQLAGDRR